MDVVRAEHGNPGFWMQPHGSLDGQFFFLPAGNCNYVGLSENAIPPRHLLAPQLHTILVEATLSRSNVRGHATCHALRDQLRKMTGVPSLLTARFAAKLTVLGKAKAT